MPQRKAKGEGEAGPVEAFRARSTLAEIAMDADECILFLAPACNSYGDMNDSSMQRKRFRSTRDGRGRAESHCAAPPPFIGARPQTAGMMNDGKTQWKHLEPDRL